ncbi:hypothetical protein J2S41_001691 [Catenuloplanes atrovinosus]|uniref:Uncharacterized protein n=1 Tax=Catenuloplanes atrovinosus TaxID=137266 RepID=A0AAE3YJB9_9ACTN|nr:hypothetical protein [Catenuloplanes atrovinosus]
MPSVVRARSGVPAPEALPVTAGLTADAPLRARAGAVR